MGQSQLVRQVSIALAFHSRPFRKQLYKQIAYICACSAYSEFFDAAPCYSEVLIASTAFVVTCLLAKGIDMIPGLSLRATEYSEALGMDETEVRVDSGRQNVNPTHVATSCVRLANSPAIISRLDGTSWTGRLPPVDSRRS